MSASSLSPVRRALPDDVGSIEGALAEAGPTVVALSGGVDSSVMALLLRRALGDRAFAATLAGPAVSRREIDRATEVARWIGISHEVVEADPLAVEGYRTNPSNRCYFCRSVEGQAILRWAGPRGIRSFVDGIHRDDLTDDRPGIRALEEVGFR
ncbi:MAG TPA: asparagine synthase-related protein, partial [Thermoplasmata archaeon]|nr:asparagine synthase-related protein [Thermoplasmata archaeon]